MTTIALEPKKAHPLTLSAFAVALAAALLASYGSFLSEKHLAGSPLNVARQEPGLEVTKTSTAARRALEAVAYFVPFGLGIVGAIMGVQAMKAIEGKTDALGNLAAVFAVLLGGFAMVLSGCMILSQYLWKYVPNLYTM